jgi:hypothetical protein
MTNRDRIIVGGLLLAALLVAPFGMHALELVFSGYTPAIVSHSLALVLIAVAVWQWRVRRSRA